MNSKQSMTEDAMYGMTEDEIQSQYMESITARFSGLEMVIAGILSDCQEMNQYQHAAKVNQDASKERIRQQLNVAKHILFKMVDRREAKFE
jgi:hypothetical protein